MLFTVTWRVKSVNNGTNITVLIRLVKLVTDMHLKPASIWQPQQTQAYCQNRWHLNMAKGSKPLHRSGLRFLIHRKIKPNIVTCQQFNYPDQVVFFISTCLHTFTCWNWEVAKKQPQHSNELTPIKIFILFSRRSIFVTLQHLNLRGFVAISNLKIEKKRVLWIHSKHRFLCKHQE